MGLCINTVGRFFICIACERALLPPVCKGHMKTHSIAYRSAEESLLLRYSEKYKIVQTFEEFKNHISQYNRLTAFEGLPIQEGFICDICKHGFTSKKSYRAHRSKGHEGNEGNEGNSTSSKPVDKTSTSNKEGMKKMQHFFLNPQASIYLEVHGRLATQKGTDALADWLSVESQTPAVNYTRVPVRELPAWLKQLGWMDLVQGLDPENFHRFKQELKETNLFGEVSMALTEYLKRSTSHLTNMRAEVRQILASETK